jgi:lactoylglutathione lyase
MRLNHVLVLTTNLKAMECFWTKLIGLQVGERPPFPFNGLWIYSDDRPLIHVAEQTASAFGNGAIAHVALEGADYKDLLERLGKSTYVYTEKVVPLSGERQVFIVGPDGLIVEMFFPLNEQQDLTENKQQLAYKTNEHLEFLGGKIL